MVPDALADASGCCRRFDSTARSKSNTLPQTGWDVEVLLVVVDVVVDVVAVGVVVVVVVDVDVVAVVFVGGVVAVVKAVGHLLLVRWQLK